MQHLFVNEVCMFLNIDDQDTYQKVQNSSSTPSLPDDFLYGPESICKLKDRALRNFFVHFDERFEKSVVNAPSHASRSSSQICLYDARYSKPHELNIGFNEDFSQFIGLGEVFPIREIFRATLSAGERAKTLMDHQQEIDLIIYSEAKVLHKKLSKIHS
ncbi:hypothetical protein CEW89_15060 [Celeribacter ethanolicus]|uniref:Uncharacterized protein n=2 Tax=Celeribacter ethanolicus TaxID=1758178 RepID=A0A291GF07_9RHOB|nr:hypothetical protein CEW89_15060 [Celeribacter ethanolicus]